MHSLKSEKIIAMPAWPRRDIEWPTVVFFLINTFIHAASIFCFLYWGGIFWYLSPLLNILCTYASFTVLHEASHRNIFRKADSWGNDILGFVTGIVMHGSFEQFIGIHLKHHSSVNDPENDPDYHAHGKLSAKSFLVWALTVPHYFKEYIRLGLHSRRNSALVILPYLLIFSIYLLAFLNNGLVDILLLWTLPSLIGVGLIVFVFDFLPHHPHSDQSRYGNATVYNHPQLNWITMGHSFHIVHHLWASIPWYRYEEIYMNTRQELLNSGVKETTISDHLASALPGKSP